LLRLSCKTIWKVKSCSPELSCYDFDTLLAKTCNACLLAWISGSIEPNHFPTWPGDCGSLFHSQFCFCIKFYTISVPGICWSWSEYEIQYRKSKVSRRIHVHASVAELNKIYSQQWKPKRHVLRNFYVVQSEFQTKLLRTILVTLLVTVRFSCNKVKLLFHLIESCKLAIASKFWRARIFFKLTNYRRVNPSLFDPFSADDQR
jgi:hypothetical protein